MLELKKGSEINVIDCNRGYFYAMCIRKKIQSYRIHLIKFTYKSYNSFENHQKVC